MFETRGGGGGGIAWTKLLWFVCFQLLVARRAVGKALASAIPATPAAVVDGVQNLLVRSLVLMRRHKMVAITCGTCILMCMMSQLLKDYCF